MNKVFLIGNLTRNPELKSTSAGTPVCNFTVAVNRRFRNSQTGQRETDFLNVVAWRQLDELCSRYLSKGRKVAVTGSIQTRTYEAKDGTKRVAWDIVAEEVEFLTSQSQKNSGSFGAPTSAPQDGYIEAAGKDGRTDSAPQHHGDYGGFTEVDDDQLPF